MQLSTSKPIKHAVTALTATLLGVSLATAEPTRLESSILLYSETDRVQAAEGILSVNRDIGAGYSLTGKFTYDALTGATPNGATPSSGIQTFTRPSGNGQYQVQPGSTPLDDTFHDTRFGLDATLSKQLNRTTTISFGARGSGEYDYLSLGANAGISREFNKKNTTVGLSAAFSHDQISPEGGIPVAFASMPLSDPMPRVGPDDSKSVFDIVVGFSQVLDRQTIARVNYSFNHASGYLTDPFKILSVVEPSASPSAGEPVDYVYENRPDSRTKHALYGQVKRYLGGHTLDASYRYFWDTWGVQSHTVDLLFRLHLPNDHVLRPHVRWYHQSAADFYRLFLVNGDAIPEHASADTRLAKFDAYTLGLDYSIPIVKGTRLNFGAEWYTQVGDSSPPEAYGALKDFDLYPEMKAILIRAGFSRDF